MRSLRRACRHGEIEDEVWPDQRFVELEDLIEIQPARDVAGKAGEEEPVGDDQLALPQRGQDDALDAVSEIGGVEEREFQRAEDPNGLAALDNRLNQIGRVPLGGDDVVAAGFEPGFEQLSLRSFPRSVRAFEGDKQASPPGPILEMGACQTAQFLVERGGGHCVSRGRQIISTLFEQTPVKSAILTSDPPDATHSDSCSSAWPADTAEASRRQGRRLARRRRVRHPRSRRPGRRPSSAPATLPCAIATLWRQRRSSIRSRSVHLHAGRQRLFPGDATAVSRLL